MKLRLQHYDPKNWVIEQYRPGVNPKNKEVTWSWVRLGYWGRIEDTVPVLIELLLELPEGVEIKEQLNTLSKQMQDIRNEVIGIIKEALVKM